jgi:tRNA (cytidine/uridine-2'-O-)-methyltransferase
MARGESIIMSQPVCQVILFEPEIPPNTGNIIRLCANTGTRLHLIEPLGYELDDRRLRRAGLDYREFAEIRVHADLDHALAELAGCRIFPCTTKGHTHYSAMRFQAGDCLLFGPETRGLPAAVLARFPAQDWLRIPMQADSRSLNLSNAVAVLVYELWRQLDFSGSV